ncbi:Multicopper oxidase [Geoalkalibacter ferrihydriticus]|uniref:Multicopper oxidase n=1 Tax=Geoalkalibacter ferrihydriticus TaxID=392333 RepID=A0A1G9MWZ7_9BACT|nr:multicopper oxidase domain-containing protein [Geoalkalibacter ferrihydriticus]SDL78447.1 Multicopper oxidase [Geoalkalibacter ferrihydriticus]
MATIPRDLGSPFNPDDPIDRAEFEGFAADVPNTRTMIQAVQTPPAIPNANSVRAHKLFHPNFIALLQDLPNDADFPTPDEVVADVILSRSGRRRDADIFPPNDPNANNGIRVWSFRDDEDLLPDRWPAPTIRVREGDIVHTRMSNSHGPHSIHHHGIEPTPVNDGVGHLTMEIGGPHDAEDGGGEYLYQWKAAEAGTYFYHCHRNTVLHFELGMYGPLIVDALEPPGETELVAPYADGGPGYTLLENAPTRYDKETFWVVDDIDLRWHGVEGDNIDKDFGIQALDAPGGEFTGGWQNIPVGGLNDFNPSFFVVTGVTIGEDGVIEQPTQAQMDRNDSLGALYEFVRPTIAPGEKLLIRALNASYCTTVWRFPTSIDGWVTAVDARTLGRDSAANPKHRFGKYSQAFRLSDLPLVDGHRQFTLMTAQRWDILIDQGSATTHQVLVEFRHWLNYELVLHTAILPVTVGQTG